MAEAEPAVLQFNLLPQAAHPLQRLPATSLFQSVLNLRTLQAGPPGLYFFGNSAMSPPYAAGVGERWPLSSDAEQGGFAEQFVQLHAFSLLGFCRIMTLIASISSDACWNPLFAVTF